MKKREWFALLILAAAIGMTLLINTNKIYITGSDGERLFSPETRRLLWETAAVFLVSLTGNVLAKNQKQRILILGSVTGVFCWLHQIFLPVTASGLYLVVIMRTGCIIRSFFDKKGCLKQLGTAAYFADLTLGCVGLILLYCLMSLAGVGSIAVTRIAALGLGVLSFLPLYRNGADSSGVSNESEEPRGGFLAESKESGRSTFPAACVVALVLSMLLLQAGRMNICADYDSLHYSLRSEYILNDGDGIYENMGSINVVYTYSKGLEILLLPLSGLPSYSFFLSFQLWMTVGILLAAGEITGLFVNRNLRMFCMAVLSCIPGIMNMAISAKTDTVTVLFQLIMIYFLLTFIQRQKVSDLVLAGHAFFMTMVLKPTALVFSTVAAVTAFLYMALVRRFRVDGKDRWFVSWIAGLLMWFLVWLRTWLHTGLPVTSVFYSIWEKMGFSARFPYLFSDIPSNGSDLSLYEALKHFLKRLYGVLLAPVGSDMSHVRIAWGTSLMFVFLVLFLTLVLVRMNRLEEDEKHPLGCLIVLFLTNGAVSLAALYLLWQVDGNYFMLLYCLCTILAVVAVGKMESIWMPRFIPVLLLPVLLFNVSVTAVSNWSGTLGTAPLSWAHRGYYDHWADVKEQMIYRGNAGIWDILAQNPEHRVVVYGREPEMLMFPCNTQSYQDISGSGGNYYVSASAENLVEFFDYAKIDYVYISGGYVEPGTEAWAFLVEMIVDGYLTDIIYENGNALARFTKEPELAEDSEEILRTFAQSYWAGEQR